MNRKCVLVFFVLFGLLLTLPSLAQRGTVRGLVKAPTGEPLVGAGVTLKNSTRGTVTDGTGRFTLADVPANAMLTVSSVGYVAQDVPVGAQTDLTITLAADSRGLEEVVVVGYGTRRRVETTGAIASIKAEELQITPNANVAQGLQARVAGVQITQNSAAPGGNVSVRVRGTNSINGTSEPLYVIDGIQFGNGGGTNEISPLSLINPNDIESIEVLKDASATAIYGARAANGVVLITTRRGKAGGTVVAYDGYYGAQTINKRLDVLNASEFATLENEIYKRAVYDNPASLGEGTDWQSLVYRTAPIQDHQLSITGGSEKTRLALTGGYFNQQGVVNNTGFQRYSLRLNLDHDVTDRLRVGTSLFGSVATSNGVNTAPTNSDNYGTVQAILGATLAAPPTLKPYREDGSLWPFLDQNNGFYAEVVNPLGYLNEKRIDSRRRTLANLYAEYQLVPGLRYRASFNADLGNGLLDFYSPRSNLSQSQLQGGGGSGSKTNSYNQLLLHESILTYTRKWADRHSLTFTGLFATQKEVRSSNTLTGSFFPNDATQNEALQLATNRQLQSGKQQERLDSYMGRVNYGFRDKYFVDLTARYDGSSKFGANQKYGFFPAVAVAWRLIEEPFLKTGEALSDLKLRGSYGLTGNAGALGPYQSLATVSNSIADNYYFNGVYAIGIRPSGIPNPDLRWERSAQLNVGLDLALLNNRISLTADAYNKRTDDLLFVKLLPFSSGYADQVGNFAKLQNRGIELAFNARVLTGAVKWDVGGNFTLNRNKVLELDGTTLETPRANYAILRVGQPVGLFKTYIFDGIYQTGEAFLPGSDGRLGGHRVKDVNGDGQISGDDRVVTGDPNPAYLFGLTSSVRWKGFDVSTLITGVQGNDVLNLMRYSLENPLGQRNQLQGIASRWSPTNPSQEYASGFVNGRLPYSSTFVENGSYVRIRNVTVGYTLPKRAWLNQARVYLSANNLFTFTRYSGYDPEVNTFGGNNTLIGIDNGVYPVAKSLLVGLRLSL